MKVYAIRVILSKKESISAEALNSSNTWEKKNAMAGKTAPVTREQQSPNPMQIRVLRVYGNLEVSNREVSSGRRKNT
eukprot:15365058-Ditylum_brightwellii.AAC.2